MHRNVLQLDALDNIFDRAHRLEGPANESNSETRPTGRGPSLALFLCADEAAFITGVDYLIDGGFFNLRG